MTDDTGDTQADGVSSFVLDSPPNTLDVIDSIWCWISTDETGEGVVAAPLMGPGTICPLIAADESRLAQIRPWAEAIAKRSDKPLRLIRLTTREVVEDLPCGDNQRG